MHTHINLRDGKDKTWKYTNQWKNTCYEINSDKFSSQQVKSNNDKNKKKNGMHTRGEQYVRSKT